MATHDTSDEREPDKPADERAWSESHQDDTRRRDPLRGDGCKNIVRVRAIRLPCADSQAKDWDKEYEPLAGIEMTLRYVDDLFTVTTDHTGTGIIEIPADDATTNSHFVYPKLAGHTATSKWIPNELGEQVLILAYAPEPAEVRVFAYARPRNGDREPLVPIENIGINFSQSGHGRSGCSTTDAKGFAIIKTPCPGVVKYGVQEFIEHHGCRYRAEYTELTSDVPPGQQCEDVEFLYVLTGANISVSTWLRKPNGEEVPFEYPVSLALYRGTATGPVFRTATSLPRQAVDFVDVEADSLYRLVAATSAAGFELVDDHKSGVVLKAQSGQTLKLHLSFQQCLGRIRFQVADTCGAAVESASIEFVSEDGDSQVLRTDSAGAVEAQLEVGKRYTASIHKQNIRGREMIPVDTPRYDFVVSREQRVRIFEFGLQVESFDIYGTVYQEDGTTPLPHALIEVRDNQFQQIGTTTSDERGNYRFPTAGSGLYYVNLATEFGVPQQRLPANVQSNRRVDIIHTQGSGTPRATTPREHHGNVSQAVEQLSAFPLLTEPISIAAAPAAGGVAVGGRLGQVVQGALRDVLAWRAKPNDPKGFVAALKSAFTFEEVEGRRQSRWTPRNYAVTTDLGSAVTGAQASIYTRAKVALDNALPLLDGLSPLKNDPDDEDIDALRSIVRSEFSELVNELGQEGGPRVDRVDSLLELLLGVDINASPPSPQNVGGALGKLRDEFGFLVGDVNTVEEEQNLTNYFIVVEYITSIRDSWISQREAFRRGFLFDNNGDDNVYLGTQLVHISRALAVVSESAQELARALSSVFLGGAERQTTELRFRGDAPPLFISELLDWVERFASSEGPGLVQEGGKLGVGAFYPTVERLVTLVGQARISPSSPPIQIPGHADDPGGFQDRNAVPASFASVRVQRALQELYEQLNNLEEFASPYKPNNKPNAAKAT